MVEAEFVDTALFCSKFIFGPRENPTRHLFVCISIQLVSTYWTFFHKNRSFYAHAHFSTWALFMGIKNSRQKRGKWKKEQGKQGSSKEHEDPPTNQEANNTKFYKVLKAQSCLRGEQFVLVSYFKRKTDASGSTVRSFPFQFQYALGCFRNWEQCLYCFYSITTLLTPWKHLNQ